MKSLVLILGVFFFVLHVPLTSFSQYSTKPFLWSNNCYILKLDSIKVDGTNHKYSVVEKKRNIFNKADSLDYYGAIVIDFPDTMSSLKKNLVCKVIALKSGLNEFGIFRTYEAYRISRSGLIICRGTMATYMYKNTLGYYPIKKSLSQLLVKRN